MLCTSTRASSTRFGSFLSLISTVQNNPGSPVKCIVLREKLFDPANFPNLAATPIFEGCRPDGPIFRASRNRILWWFFRTQRIVPVIDVPFLWWVFHFGYRKLPDRYRNLQRRDRNANGIRLQIALM